MKARDMIFYIRALTTIILAEQFRHFRLGSIMEKISDKIIAYLLSIITTVLLKLYSFISQALYFLCVTDSLLTTITTNYCSYYRDRWIDLLSKCSSQQLFVLFEYIEIRRRRHLSQANMHMWRHYSRFTCSK
jgi:hypothetical protein